MKTLTCLLILAVVFKCGSAFAIEPVKGKCYARSYPEYPTITDIFKVMGVKKKDVIIRTYDPEKDKWAYPHEVDKKTVFGTATLVECPIR